MTDIPDTPVTDVDPNADIDDSTMAPADGFRHMLDFVSKLDPELIVGLCMVVGVAQPNSNPGMPGTDNKQINVTEFYIGPHQIISSLHLAQYKTLQRMINNVVQSQMMHFIAHEDKETPPCSSTSF